MRTMASVVTLILVAAIALAPAPGEEGVPGETPVQLQPSSQSQKSPIPRPAITYSINIV